MSKRKSQASRQAVRASGSRRSEGFQPCKRHLALAIQLLFAIGAGETWAASCILDGRTLNSPTTNSVFCRNGGTLTVGPGGSLTNTAAGTLANLGALISNSTLTNNGLITNSGSFTNTGSFNGSGTLTNTGTVAVSSGSVRIAKSGNLAGGTLTGGTWLVGGGGSKSKAALTIDSGAITTNDATIGLIGAGASFAQLSGLANNQGSLTISGGARFTSAALYNTGTLTVASGGVASIAKSKNLSGDTLSGGRWVVDNSAGGAASLTIGSGAIRTNNADIELIGAGAYTSFAQLSGLAKNTGSLTVGAGASLGSKASLYNTGTLTVTSGGSVQLAKSANLSSGTLSGGKWVVDGSGGSAATLAIGTGNITTNKAQVELIGANASFAQLAALANNQGQLTIGSGASFTTLAALNNTGTIVTGVGGTLNLTSSKLPPLTNNGTITNSGSLVVASKLGGNGTLENAGSLLVLSGGDVRIAKSSNFANGTLTGGSWVVDGSGPRSAALTIGSGNITTNDANIELIGANASFGQLAALASNKGSLTIGGGRNFTSASLNNTGTIAVTSGSVNIAKSGNFSKGTLSGGTWLVGGGDSKSKASLAIGSGAITTNDANIGLIGLGASFAQLSGLASNKGSLTISEGARFTSAALNNTGTLTVASGGTANLASSKNLSGTTLSGGRWVVDNSAGGAASLVVGSGAIRTNNANIELLGAGAYTSFAQLQGLANNTGSLTVGAGASLGSKASLYNTGTLTVGSGSSVQLLSSKNLASGKLSGGNWIVDGSGGSAATLAMGSGNITTNNANVELIGPDAHFAQLSGLANNQGSLTVTSGASLTTSVALNNTGTIVTGLDGSLSLSSSKQKLSVTNNGSITNAGRLTGTGNFNNAGSLVVESTGEVSGFINFIQTSGTTTLKDGGLLSARSVQFLGGMLAGSGTVDPPSPIVIGAGAIVAPTTVLTLEGNTQFGGELDIGIRGASDYSILNVLGSIDFGAGAKIDFGFDPDFDLTDSSYLFKFLFAKDGIHGLENLAFDYTGLDPLYSSRLEASCQSAGCDYSLLLTRIERPGAVPEPGTLLLATFGLLGFALGRRKPLAGPS